jgi:dolichyl-diphosphooligosaccharide--protein glycosyltransferase
MLPAIVRWPLKLLLIIVQAFLLMWFLYAAYEIRMYPIKDFGYTIHEFDPWFNYRATEYLAENGLSKFYKWYDYKSWYPMGRPIGTTIYPGMQITAVAIWEGMKLAPVIDVDIPKELRKVVHRTSKFFENAGFIFLPYLPKKLTFKPMTVNQICCMIPPWFGSIASFFCGLLTFEVSRSVNAGVMATGVMAVIPAHLMRSVGGKFDNEAIAMAAICSTFWLWVRSVRSPSSWPFGIFAGLSYVYMVAAWGGYIFVLNMIGIHALMLVGLGRFNSGVHKAYTLFYVIGTYGAMQIPVVGWTPLRSLEQLGPFGVFLGYQVLAIIDRQRRKHNLDATELIRLRCKAFGVLVAILICVTILLWPMGYFGPLSSRIRGLFMKHTKTGNPLVDSVAEHQPANAGIYGSYLHLPLDYCLFGGLVCLFNRNNGAYFVALYGFIASHFSGKMSRLVLICAPIVSVVCGIWLGFIFDLILAPVLGTNVAGLPLPQAETNGNGDKDQPSQAQAAAKGKAAAQREYRS